MIEDIKSLTLSEQVDLAITQAAHVEKSLIRLRELLGGEDKRLKNALAEVVDIREDITKLNEERRLIDRKGSKG